MTAGVSSLLLVRAALHIFIPMVPRGERGDERTRPLVLVLEDNRELLRTFTLVLENEGYSVASAPDGEEGLRLVVELRPDVVILDMMLPEMDGLQFLDRLSALPYQPPVVASSGFDGFQSEALARGATTFLFKPVPVETLLSTVSQVLRETRPEPPPPPQDRHAMDRARDAFWAQLEDELPGLAHTFSGLVRWLPRYFGCGRSWIDILSHGRVRVVVGDAVGRVLAPPNLPFCADVMEAGSSLVISDARSHPVFVHHPATSTLKSRFYAGVPITVQGQLSVATLCLFDTVPHEFHSEDLRLLEFFAHEIGAHLDELARGRHPDPPFFTPPCLFHRPTLDALLTHLQGSLARHGGAVELALVEFQSEREESEYRFRIEPALNHGPHALTRFLPRTLAVVMHERHPAGLRAHARQVLDILASCERCSIGEVFATAQGLHSPHELIERAERALEVSRREFVEEESPPP